MSTLHDALRRRINVQKGLAGIEIETEVKEFTDYPKGFLVDGGLTLGASKSGRHPHSRTGSATVTVLSVTSVSSSSSRNLWTTKILSRLFVTLVRRPLRFLSSKISHRLRSTSI